MTMFHDKDQLTVSATLIPQTSLAVVDIHFCGATHGTARGGLSKSFKFLFPRFQALPGSAKSRQ